MEASKALQALKVTELKARCKELRIPNYSKLSKADLIAKIVEAASGKDTDLTTQSTTQSASTQAKVQYPSPNNSTTPKGNGGNGAAKGGKEGNAKKRKAPDQAGPSSKSSRDRDGSTREVELPTHIAQPQPTQDEVIPSSEVTTTLPDTTAKTGDPPVANKTKTVKSKDTAPKPKAQRNIPVTISGTASTTSKPLPKPKAPVLPKPRSTPKPSLALKPQEPTQAQTGPKSQTFWKTTATATTKPKGRPSILTEQQARPRFTGLVSTKPVEAPAPAPRPNDIEIDLSTVTARIAFIESHFLNTLFTLLHQYRAKSITSNYPCPPSFTKSAKYKSTSHLAFQGFHPDIYDTEDGFKVAIRFWIARMHSYMQLGSGEAWSGSAGAMGMLGPDMTTWPPIVGVERVTEEVWAVKTEEEMGEVRYLVMGEIGEVVASSKGITGHEVLVSGCVVRSDWAKYLGSRDRKKLESTVKTKESYYFPNGIARNWAAKQSEGMIKIANRAVLASCALNSFSGEKMSSTVMDAAHIGRPAQGIASNDLDFYLPENSQILSVHRPANLHPDLAIVQRGSGFSEFVLAETGQMVGLEDEGVVSLWQGLLNCNTKGEADESGQKPFWKQWESRMKFI